MSSIEPTFGASGNLLNSLRQRLEARRGLLESNQATDYAGQDDEQQQSMEHASAGEAAEVFNSSNADCSLLRRVCHVDAGGELSNMDGTAAMHDADQLLLEDLVSFDHCQEV